MRKQRIITLLLEGCSCINKGPYFEITDANRMEVHKVFNSIIEEMEDEGLVRVDSNHRDDRVIIL